MRKTIIGLAVLFLAASLLVGCVSTTSVSQESDSPTVNEYTGTPPVGDPIANTTRTMRAVCIGWNSVDPAAYGGWSGALPDCEFDAEFSADMWKEYGLATTCLVTSVATRDACKEALKWGLNGLKSGDWLIVWVSGHGGQTDDYNGDESDGLDEYVCAYDGPVRDDTINEWLEQVPDGVCILWMCDTCHSGTMHREPMHFRKSAIPRGFAGQLILISGCTESGTSQSTGQGGVLSLALHDTGPAGQTPASWATAVQDLIPTATQDPQYVEYGNVTDDFRFGLIVE